MQKLAWVLLGWFVGLASASARGDGTHGSDVEPPDADEDYLEDDFVFDVVARTNESVVSNIDAADLALLAVLAAISAVAVFGIDKIRELAWPWNAIAYALLGTSAVACVLGYLVGAFGTRESIDPRSFVVDFAADPDGTTANATRGVVRAYYVNAADRRWKRIAVCLALALLVVGTVIVAVARSAAPMVK